MIDPLSLALGAAIGACLTALLALGIWAGLDAVNPKPIEDGNWREK